MDPTFITTVLLPAAVGVIMFGLGLALTPADFARVMQFPRAVIVGLLVQTIVLVTVAFAITQLFALPPLLAVGFMLLAASPGGAMANIFSHLAHGDVALNITLTAINSVLALVWLPLVLNWSLVQFLGAELHVPAPTQKILEVATVIILPVLIGMLVRYAWPAPARRAAGTVRAASVLLLALVVAISLANSGETMLQHFGTVGLACITLNLVSLAIGYASFYTGQTPTGRIGAHLHLRAELGDFGIHALLTQLQRVDAQPVPALQPPLAPYAGGDVARTPVPAVVATYCWRCSRLLSITTC